MTDKELLAYIYGIVSTNKYGTMYSPIYDVLKEHFEEQKEEDGPSAS
tara:strand:+ start:325 stop:465 length:141 start_codon:yes stop_codon:yes gene_type:complete